ncbi:MAG TPA: AraC family transcriptional regulator [Chthoniobacteraceae bacterium]|nr:AraC family transcriptional regulator [Chthoniobacteraceae bacterium]
MNAASPRQAVIQRAQGINRLADYYSGFGEALTPHLPHNVICFSRLSSSALGGSQPHQHHRTILLIAVEGRGKVSVDMETFSLEPGEALLIFPFSFHAYTDFPESAICWLFVTFEKGTLQEMEPLRGAGARRLGEVEWILLAETLACWGEPGRRPLLPFHLGLLLQRLAATGGAPPGFSPGDGEAQGAGAALLRKVNSHLFPRLDQPLPVKAIARAMGQSESHFRARFRAVAGVGLGRHVRRLRMKRASDLLHTSSLSVSEVARQCGFESLYAFSRAFKAEYGVSPRAYRRSSLPEPTVSPLRRR